MKRAVAAEQALEALMGAHDLTGQMLVPKAIAALSRALREPDPVEAAVQAEREACARLLDEMDAQDRTSNYYAVAARAIRARGEQ